MSRELPFVITLQRMAMPLLLRYSEETSTVAWGKVWCGFQEALLDRVEESQGERSWRRAKGDKSTIKLHGCPLLLGEVDSNVQVYIKALRKAGAPISNPLILCCH